MERHKAFLGGEFLKLAITHEGRQMPEQLLPLEQVTQYLNVDKFIVYRLLAQKKLPAFKVGHQWRFKKRMIQAWLARNSNIQEKRQH